VHEHRDAGAGHVDLHIVDPRPHAAEVFDERAVLT
jgi:hypothetical protein